MSRPRTYPTWSEFFREERMAIFSNLMPRRDHGGHGDHGDHGDHGRGRDHGGRDDFDRNDHGRRHGDRGGRDHGRGRGGY